MSLHDEADEALPALANEKGKFAIPLGHVPIDELQEAFERGIDHEWFTLVDVSTIANYPGTLRIFRLTQAGHDRLSQLRSREHTR